MLLRWEGVNPAWVSGINMSLRNDQGEWRIPLNTVIDLGIVTWLKTEQPEPLKQNSRFLIETWDIEHFFLLKLNKVLGETEGKMGLDIQKKKKKKMR